MVWGGGAALVSKPSRKPLNMGSGEKPIPEAFHADQLPRAY
ncbi:MAG: hypothetical protein CM15mP120_21420 [Pseudomonadota bacterium]|nr:MAG: hypothetical protein CM15mP120_21420 [Pseudomonadota bacterium]